MEFMLNEYHRNLIEELMKEVHDKYTELWLI